MSISISLGGRGGRGVRYPRFIIQPFRSKTVRRGVAGCPRLVVMSVTGGEGGEDISGCPRSHVFLGNGPDSSKSKYFEKILPRAFQRHRFTTAELCGVVRVTGCSETAKLTQVPYNSLYGIFCRKILPSSLELFQPIKST